MDIRRECLELNNVSLSYVRVCEILSRTSSFVFVLYILFSYIYSSSETDRDEEIRSGMMKNTWTVNWLLRMFGWMNPEKVM